MSYEMLYKQAAGLYAKGDLPQAEQIYRQLLAFTPENPDLLNMLGLIAQQKNLHREAAAYFSRALTFSPKHIPLLFNLAVSLAQTDKIAEAADIYERILNLNPNLKEAYNNLGAVYEKLKEPAKAEAAYKKALSLDSGYLEAAVNLSFLRNSDSELTKLSQQYPHSPLPLYYLALSAYQRADYEAALNYAGQAAELDHNSFEIIRLYACSALKLNDHKTALTLFKRVLNLNPNCVDAMVHIGILEPNETMFRQALNLEPENIEAHAGYAAFLHQENRFLEALEEYRKAICLNPEMPALSNNLGLILKDLGEYEQALDLFMNALLKQPDQIDFSINMAETLTLLHSSQPKKALKIARLWLKNAPENIFARKICASFTHTFFSDEKHYNEILFDNFAAGYEKVMQNIKYRILDEIKKLQIDFKGKILDLGCGTGLAGQTFKLAHSQWIGVDLSQKMLDIAAQKNVYSDLIKGDIADYLERTELRFDFILAIDVLDYIEDIEKIFQNIKSGNFIFSIEKANAETKRYQLSATGRFKHNPHYIKDVLRENGFAQIESYDLILRQENGFPVEGLIYTAYKNA